MASDQYIALSYCADSLCVAVWATHPRLKTKLAFFAFEKHLELNMSKIHMEYQTL